MTPTERAVESLESAVADLRDAKVHVSDGSDKAILDMSAENANGVLERIRDTGDDE